ncbi:MAG: DUF4831 family protein [Phocaeicola sp.]
MKEGIIALALITPFCGMAQGVTKYNPSTMGDGVVYYLPKSELQLEIVIDKVTYTPGEFCQYANRYLRLTDISATPYTYWKINGISVKSVGAPDSENAYRVKLKEKMATSAMELTAEGIIKAINTTTPNQQQPAATLNAATRTTVNPRSFMTEEILSAGSTAKMAELVAKEIYSIRESKNSLTRGQADYMPSDGAALKLMLDNLELQENSMTEMFSGITKHEIETVILRIPITEEFKEKIAFRFSNKLGIVDANNLSGLPFYLSLTNLDAKSGQEKDAKKEKKRVEGIIYNIPGKGQVTVSSQTECYFDNELPITQFGTTEVLIDNLFNKKNNTRVVFNPDTGTILKIDKD